MPDPPREGAPFAPTFFGGALGLAIAASDPATRAATSKGLALGVVLLAALALLLPRRLRAPAPSIPTVAWTLLAGWTAASLAWSDHGAATDLLPFLLVAAGAQVGMGLVRLRDHLATAATTAFVVSGLLWVLGDPTAGHGNPNWLGLTAMCLLPFALDGWWRAPARSRVAIGGAVVAGVALLVIGRSRTAAIGLVAAGALFAPGAWRLAAASPLALLVLWRDELTASLAGRWRLWGDAWSAASLPGAGLGDGSHALMAAQGARLQTLSIDTAAQQFAVVHTAHQDLLQALDQGGLLAAMLMAMALATTAWLLRRRYRAGAASVVAVAVAGLGDAPLTLGAVAVVMGLVAGAAPALERPRRGSDRLVALALAIALGAVLPSAARRFIAHRELTAWQATPRKPLGDVEAIARIAPGDGHVALALATAQLREGHPAEALVALDEARRRLPGLAPDLLTGDAHLALGDPHAAALAYRRALALHPASFRGALALARAERSRGELASAEAAFAIATEVRPHDPELTELRETLRRDRIDAETQ